MANMLKLGMKDGLSYVYIKPEEIIMIADRDFSHGTITLSNGEKIDIWETADEAYEMMVDND